MAKFRKLYVKILDSQDFDALADDFQRLMWVLLPLVVDSEGRGIDHPAWVRSKIFPMRTDVTLETVETAMTAFARFGMIERYHIDGRNYFYLPAWKSYQGDTSKEADSVIPAPPPTVEEIDYEPTPDLLQTYSGVGPELLQSNSRVTPDLLQSKSRVTPELVKSNSRSDADADADADSEADADAGVPQPPQEFDDFSLPVSSNPGASIGEKFWVPRNAVEASTHSDIHLYQTVTRKMPREADYERVVSAIYTMRFNQGLSNDAILDRCRRAFDIWCQSKNANGRGYNRDNPAWLTDWALNDCVPTQPAGGNGKGKGGATRLKVVGE